MSEPSLLEQIPGASALAERLPSPPTVALEVLRAADDPETTLEDLATIISRDPALAVKLVKIANSSTFARGQEVTSLQQATVRLGLKAVTLMSLSFSLTEQLSQDTNTNGFDYAMYWKRSLVMAAAGRALCRLLRDPRGDEAFLCGLLGRLGQLVMAQALDQDYAAVTARSRGTLPNPEVERELLGYDFHQVGAALLQSWGLPPAISTAVGAWSNPAALADATDEATAKLTRIVHLANGATSVICSEEKGLALARVHEVAQTEFGLSEDESDTWIVDLEQHVQDLSDALEIAVETESFRDIVDRARNETVRISLNAAADLQHFESRTEELERENEELASKASTDALTGIPNRAHFDAMLQRVIDARLAGESEKALGVLILDVDHFKSFNDTHGHQVGDEVLKLVAQCLTASTRSTDIAARYGGEEFVVIVPNTRRDDLQGVAERIRQRIEETTLEHGGETLSVTASFGGACVQRVTSHEDGAALLKLADKCLYEAKEAGRNRSICLEVESTPGA